MFQTLFILTDVDGPCRFIRLYSYTNILVWLQSGNTMQQNSVCTACVYHVAFHDLTVLYYIHTDILVSPQNTTVFLNQPAVVSCETSGADFMIWRINGTSIPNLPPEIRSDLESENEGDNERDVFTLTITGRVTYNTTTVQCVIGRIGGDIIESENAIIRIQGIPIIPIRESVVDSLAYIDSLSEVVSPFRHIKCSMRTAKIAISQGRRKD